jgi:hypothetical protein
MQRLIAQLICRLCEVMLTLATIEFARRLAVLLQV